MSSDSEVTVKGADFELALLKIGRDLTCRSYVSPVIDSSGYYASFERGQEYIMAELFSGHSDFRQSG